MLWAYTVASLHFAVKPGMLVYVGPMVISVFLCKKTFVTISTFMNTVYLISMYITLWGCLKSSFTDFTFKLGDPRDRFLRSLPLLRLRTEEDLLLVQNRLALKWASQSGCTSEGDLQVSMLLGRFSQLVLVLAGS